MLTVRSQIHIEGNYKKMMTASILGLLLTIPAGGNFAAINGASHHTMAPHTLIAAAGITTSARREVLGVRLGASPKEVLTALSKQKPPFADAGGVQMGSVAGLPNNGAYPAHLETNNAAAWPAGGRMDAIALNFSPPPLASRLIRIQRTSTYDESTRIAVDTLKNSLNEKYGNPALATESKGLGGGTTTEYLTWAWSSSGQPVVIPKSGPLAQCAELGPYYDGFVGLMSQGLSEQLAKTTKRLRDCGVGLYVRVKYGWVGGLVGDLYAEVFDVDGMLTATERTTVEINKKVSEKKAQDLQDAQARKPNL